VYELNVLINKQQYMSFTKYYYTDEFSSFSENQCEHELNIAGLFRVQAKSIPFENQDCPSFWWMYIFAREVIVLLNTVTVDLFKVCCRIF